MKFIFKLFIIIISNTLALYIANKFISDFIITTNYIGFLKVGLALGIINTFVRPILKLFSFPLIMITFGLFTFLINILLLYCASYLFDFFTINSFTAGILGLLIISITNSVLTNILKD